MKTLGIWGQKKYFENYVSSELALPEVSRGLVTEGGTSEVSESTVTLEGAVTLSWIQPRFRGWMPVFRKPLIRLTGVTDLGQASVVGTRPSELLIKELRAFPT